MKGFVKLFFTLILIGSIAVSSINIIAPALAKEIPKISETPENTTEVDETPAEVSGEEWDGFIEEPVREPATESTPKSPVVITNVTTTVTPPKTVTTPKTTSRVATTTASDATPAPTPTSEPEAEVEPEPTPEPEAEILAEEPKAESPEDPESPEDTSADIPEVPNTLSANTDGTMNETTKKITLLALISTAIVYFLCIEIWGLTKLTKTIKTEKLLRAASQKARSSQFSRQS